MSNLLWEKDMWDGKQENGWMDQANVFKNTSYLLCYDDVYE